MIKGEVYLVGAGPGDPELLTLKALRLIKEADIVVYDRLVSDKVMELINPKAEKIYAGKQRSKHSITQENLNQLLVTLAQKYHKVVRLKGGDPFIFGRGGEEIATLMQNEVPFEVVPGITAALGCAAYSGIPLTHRDYSQACLFVTGHHKDDDSELNWSALAKPNQTLVFYMGLVRLEYICQKLIENGMSENMHAALITSGTLPNQNVVVGNLCNIYLRSCEKESQPPSLLIVGEVVKLREILKWYQ